MKSRRCGIWHGVLKCVIFIAVILFILSDLSPLNLNFPDPAGMLRDHFRSASKEIKIEEFPVPASYDLRTYGKAPKARSQKDLNTCWAFARLSALESVLLPKETAVFSPDHMSFQSPGAASQYDGGSLNTADAYLFSWKGPVLEEDDPYGDKYSPENLKAVKHVQESRILKEKDYNAVKRAVMKYGGVVTSLCIPSDDDADSVYYNRTAAAFCYSGDIEDNHDALIIGWDDAYPAANFHSFAKNNGAFIVLSSWGDKFGDSGVFYVSYDDQYIGKKCEVYTAVEDTGNYDRIYQCDLFGETAAIGFNRPFVRFANVYTAGSEEQISAAGLYATGPSTHVKLYVVKNAGKNPWLWKKTRVAEADINEEGFYTLAFDHPVGVKKDERFAVMAQIETAGSDQPVAIEYSGSSGEYKTDISDGEGYISCMGSRWYSAEKDYDCNVCLKAYAKIK
jgi:C1A family cysteine protease